MNKVERIIWIVCILISLTLLAGIIDCRAATEPPQIESELNCSRNGQEFIDLKKYEEAVSSLELCLRIYPESDWLYSLLGRAYFKLGDLEQAEAQFRKALDINKNNQVAKRLILAMRKTQDLLQDRDVSEWINIGKEKIADLITLVLGVWLGMLLSGISSRFYSHFMEKSFRKAIAKKDFDYATDILEDLVAKREKALLRRHLKELLDKYELDEAREMIIEYVDDRDIEDKLVHFLVQIHKKSKNK